MWQVVMSGITALGTAVSAFFGFKKEQGDVVVEALKVIGSTSSSNADREAAVAKIIAAEAQSGYWLAAVWRPLMMVFFAVIIGSFWFGYSPPNIDDPMSPMLGRIFDILTIGIGGYIPARTIEKIVSSINIGKVLQKFIEKKLI